MSNVFAPFAINISLDRYGSRLKNPVSFAGKHVEIMYSPAEEISFTEAHLVAILSRHGSGRSLNMVFERITLDFGLM